MIHAGLIPLPMVAHNCHGKNQKPHGKNKIAHSKTKNLMAKTTYLMTKPKTSRQNQRPHGKTKHFTAKTKYLTAKANTHGKPKAILLFCFSHEVFGFAVTVVGHHICYSSKQKQKGSVRR